MDDDMDITSARIRDAEKHMRAFLECLGADMEDDNLRETPRRVAKMFACELLSGEESSGNEPPKMVSFPTPNITEKFVIVKNLPVRSLCAHHLLPISGVAHIGAFYEAEENLDLVKLPGLSKYGRVTEYFARRFQLQERLGQQIADYIFDNTEAKLVIVEIDAEHQCMLHRGIMSERSTTCTTNYAIDLETNWPKPAERNSVEFLIQQFNAKIGKI
jgi:GTP cyclohydrolase I